MSVLLIDIDSKIPNLALMKVSAYYKSQGIPVGFDIDVPDKAYISVIFAHNRAYGRSAASMLKALYPGIEIDIGGPGYDLHKVLPDCIESMQPDYSLYPEIDYAMGFTTRGCIRKCPFCIVPVKEGKLKHIQPIESIYRPEFDAIKLLDNNVMADRENFKHIVDFCEMHELKLDVSQGLDIRLLDNELAAYIGRIRPMKTLTFAFDSLKYRSSVEKGVQLLKDHGVDVRRTVQFYVYCNRSDGEYGIKSAIERCNILKSLETNAYVMLDINELPTQEMKNLKRWANRKQLFWSISFDQYRMRGALA